MQTGNSAVAEGGSGYVDETDARPGPLQTRAGGAHGLQGFEAQIMLAGAQASGAKSVAHGVDRRAADFTEGRAGLCDELAVDEETRAIA